MRDSIIVLTSLSLHYGHRTSSLTVFTAGPDENAAQGQCFQVDPRQFFGPSRYGTISWTSSFLTGFTRSSRFTPRYMAIAAATKTEE